MGGWLALMSGAREPPSVCIGALAAWNIGWAGSRFASHPEERKSNFDDFRGYTETGGPIRGITAGMLAEMSDSAQRWDYISQSRSLRDHALFLASATRDSPDEGPAMYAQLGRALKAAGAKRVKAIVYDDDHPFSAHRPQLADAICAGSTPLRENTIVRCAQATDCARKHNSRVRGKQTAEMTGLALRVFLTVANQPRSLMFGNVHLASRRPFSAHKKRPPVVLDVR